MSKQNTEGVVINVSKVNQSKAQLYPQYNRIFSEGRKDGQDQITKIVTSDEQSQGVKGSKKRGLFSSCFKCYMKETDNYVVEVPIVAVSNVNQGKSTQKAQNTAQTSLELQKKLVTQVQERHNQYIMDETLIYDKDENLIQSSDLLSVKNKDLQEDVKTKSNDITLDPTPGISERSTKELVIPKNKKLLILDLDETLVHSTFTDSEIQNADFKLSITIDDESSITYNIGVFTRPFLQEFLDEMSQLFTVWIFTASLQIYCDAVMNVIDPKGLCKRRLYRPDCKIVGQMYYKDISNFGYSLKDVILMDNSEISFGLQPENGLLCPDFFQNKKDTYLHDIMPMLRQLAVCDDVRKVLDAVD